ncbi:MAG TPA: AMP-binding protein [Gammaproteobacteria bacterium]|jgi:acyl carrier protein|nr:AMP-binding protein [Gammaproteobacteria bacterium]
MKKATREEINNALIAIVVQLLQESGEHHTKHISVEDSLQRRLGIDSLGRAELFSRVEKAFNVRLPDRLLASADTLEDVANYLEGAEPSLKKEMRDVVNVMNERSSVNPSEINTLTELMIAYGERSPDKVHVYFQSEDGGEEPITYGQLLQAARSVAGALQALGLREGETVAIMQPTTPGFFYSFFGILLAGGIPVPIYPPLRMNQLENYAKTEARILQNAEVRILITFARAETLSRLLQVFVPSLQHVVTMDALLKNSQAPDIKKPNDFAFIQYTSGSTADPKGVLLKHENVLANIRAYGQAAQVTPDDVAVSWLPLYHDMGLIGLWLGSLHFGVPLVLMTPFTFLNHPERWLWAIHRYRGTLSGGPNFAYELCIHKIELGMLEGLDLSSWRLAVNGAEKVYPDTLKKFTDKFSQFGFKRTAMAPVYGLAESSVALTLPPLGREYRIDEVDRKACEEKRRALPATNQPSLSYVGCGMPIPGHEVRIVDEVGVVLPERHIGMLQFKGPSSMQGYYRRPEATEAIYHDGWLDSGDLAYQVAGEVFITGRYKDLIIKAGRNLYPAEIEALLSQVEGVRQGCVAAFGVNDAAQGTEKLVVVAEIREKSKVKQEEVTISIQQVISDALDLVPDDIVLVPPQVVPKTSSGKLQRARCKKMYEENRLHNSVLPPMMQFLKLGVMSVGYRCLSGVKRLIKLVYTLYVGALVFISLWPIYLLVSVSSQAVAARICKRWATGLIGLSGHRVRKVGLEKLKPIPMIYAVNHSSYADVVVALAYLPTGVCFIGKKELLLVPIIRTFMRKLDCIVVDRLDTSQGVKDTEQIAAKLTAGRSVLIFPEGTFGYSSGLRPFKLGAFKVAAEVGVPVCPVAFSGVRQVLRAGEKCVSPGKITITVCDPVLPIGKEWHDMIQLRDAVRGQIAKYCGEVSLDYIAAKTVAQTFS